MADTRRQTSMETAPGTYEKPKNKKMQHQTDDNRIQTPNEPW